MGAGWHGSSIFAADGRSRHRGVGERCGLDWGIDNNCRRRKSIGCQTRFGDEDRRGVELRLRLWCEWWRRWSWLSRCGRASRQKLPARRDHPWSVRARLRPTNTDRQERPTAPGFHQQAASTGNRVLQRASRCENQASQGLRLPFCRCNSKFSAPRCTCHASAFLTIISKSPPELFFYHQDRNRISSWKASQLTVFRWRPTVNQLPHATSPTTGAAFASTQALSIVSRTPSGTATSYRHRRISSDDDPVAASRSLSASFFTVREFKTASPLKKILLNIFIPTLITLLRLHLLLITKCPSLSPNGLSIFTPAPNRILRRPPQSRL